MIGFKGKICKLGVWDQSIPDIKFDNEGISSYAKIFKRMLTDFPKGGQGQKIWVDFVAQMKLRGKNNKYDCIVGVSGGTDSSYLLHLSANYGLRVLAVYLDNGWGSKIAVGNIKKMTQALNFDLETYVINYQEVVNVFKAYLKAHLPWVDGPTDLAIKAVLYQVAEREGIKHVLIGHDFRTEGFQPNEWTYTDSLQLKFLTKKFENKKLKTFPSLSIWSFGYLAYLRNIKMIRPFFYIPYSKSDAKKILKYQYNWEDYGGHHYENIFTKFIISYWLPTKFGIDKRKITYSAQILSGEISRDFAIAEINKNPFDDSTIERDIEYVAKKLDISKSELLMLITEPGKSFKDYPSYFPLIEKMKRVVFPAMKYLLPNKPLMFYQMEEKDQ
jgi:N-acetyl sugar amidotransferase